MVQRTIRPPARWLPMFLLMLISCMLALTGAAAAESASSAGPAVYVVKAEQTVETGLESFLERAYKEAEEARADQVILILNTFGGRVDSAEAIGHLVRTSKVPTTAFVQGKAVSAGTYIALNAKSLVMQPGSTIGAAAVVDGSGDLIDNPKTVSFWTSVMMEAARQNGRNPDIAAAMVDPGMQLTLDEIGKTKKKGDILTLTASEAIKVGYAEYTAATLEEVLQHNQWEQRTIVEVEPTGAERLAEFLTSPLLMTLLLIIGIAGVAIELFVPGFGFPGIIGTLAFALYFFGHYVAGFAGMEDVVLFVIGVALLISEVFVPSFGILGILGSAAIVAGVLMASADVETALLSLAVALVAATVIVVLIAKRFKHRGVWNRFILSDKLTTEEGYVSNINRVELIGRTGETLTPLRPSGTVVIDGSRVDVVTSGEFIPAGSRIVVLKVEGTRVVVATDTKSNLL
ncbi:membrane-bound serine protease (ClpP class) [Paenibacillus phyllosphaerae]|uniref:Membrane-bound serine protease (ClpP class) n=1 Tax=Paenibacillus phyllosphaerae TaxID=274593 RepID=A0A7W5AUM7_9BACL|nr:nodulation protein NfeD [Paenibacillus phyllosphaerae]MBB3108998.1 membrane-bound serine protease (ClpP class) [Paenibacillus phyllosphaerae]